MAKKPRTEPLDAIVNIRITASERLRLQEQADFASISVSELVRRRSFGRKVVSNTDQIMIRELRRMGGLLKHLHMQNQGIYKEESAEVLKALKVYLERLADDRQKS